MLPPQDSTPPPFFSKPTFLSLEETTYQITEALYWLQCAKKSLKELSNDLKKYARHVKQINNNFKP